MNFCCLPLLLVPFLPGTARADYFDGTGYRTLAAAPGTSLPDGGGVSVTQVEFGSPAYLPQAGSGTFAGAGGYFAGKIFTAKSGASADSGHALDVAAHFYGLNTNPNAGRASFTPGVTQVDVYLVDSAGSANSWVEESWLTPASTLEPLTEPNAVQNHSWISPGSSVSAVGDNDVLRRFDYAIVRDGFLAVTGVNNGTSTVPALMASAYNNLAVGLSSGNHSTGGVPSWLDGAGRQKPEITAPLDFTSFSTAMVSSAAVLLREAANLQGGAAVLPETLKAILLAGATKEEFPGWSHTVTAPLDPVFGAGELEISNSWFILAGQGQAANLTTPLPDLAWSSTTLTTTATADYLLTLPPGFSGAALSAVAVWNRIISDSNPGPAFIMNVAPLANYDLSLARVPATGSPVLLEESLSTLENVEHVYRRNLPSGTYRLRLALASGSNVPASLAWRLTKTAHRPGIVLTRSAGQDQLTFTGLISGQAYLIQSSPDLATWDLEQSFTATSSVFTWTTAGTLTKRFYRLAAVDAA